MFKRKSNTESSKPLSNLMLEVESYVKSEGSKVHDTVVGRDLEGALWHVSLTTTGEAADNKKRNDIESFSKDKSNHHVPVGGMILFSTVWAKKPEADGEPTLGTARWAEFFGHARRELVVGNAMFSAGTYVDDKKEEIHWAEVRRLGVPLALPAEKALGAIAALTDRCNNDKTRAYPILRLVNEQGGILDYTSVKQGTVEVEEDGEKVRRAESGAQLAESAKKNTRLMKMIDRAAKGEGTLEMIPVMAIKVSPRKMNSPGGKNLLALHKRFATEEQIFASECYIRFAPTDDHNYVSHFSASPKERFDPLLIQSQNFETLTYSAELLKELGMDTPDAVENEVTAQVASAEKTTVEEKPPVSADDEYTHDDTFIR